LANAAELEELRATPLTDKAHQTAALMESGRSLGWMDRKDLQEEQVWERWNALRKAKEWSGKSTLLWSLLPSDAIIVDLSDPSERARYAARPSELISLCRALPRVRKPRVVLVDEAQSVPAIWPCRGSSCKLRATIPQGNP
jgi:hypothetical protein